MLRFLELVAVASAAPLEQWGIFEANFTGPSTGNPFVDVQLSATFTLQADGADAALSDPPLPSFARGAAAPVPLVALDFAAAPAAGANGTMPNSGSAKGSAAVISASAVADAPAGGGGKAMNFCCRDHAQKESCCAAGAKFSKRHVVQLPGAGSEPFAGGLAGVPVRADGGGGGAGAGAAVGGAGACFGGGGGAGASAGAAAAADDVRRPSPSPAGYACRGATLGTAVHNDPCCEFIRIPAVDLTVNPPLQATAC